MSIITNTTKDIKYEKDYQDNLKRLSSVLTETEQKKLTKLTEEVAVINSEQKKLQSEITQLEQEEQGLGDIIGRCRRVNQQLTALETNYSGTKTKAKNSFLGQAPNKYDWTTKMKTYYPTTYSDNLYEGTVNGTKIKITESEAIKLLTRVIKACQKIDPTKFATKFTASSHTSGTNHLPALQKLAKDGLKSNEIIGQDANGSDLPDKGKPANHQTLNRLEYSFKSQYVSDADLQKEVSNTPFTPQSTEKITQVKIDNFFAFITAISKDGTLNPDFLTELNSDTDILKNVENNTVWKIIPAQSTPLETTKLAEYGIQVANSNNTKLYFSDNYQKAVKFQITEGFKSWIELIHAFFPTGSSQPNKLSSSFSNDPYLQLLTDISSNTHSAHWELPESKEDLQTIADQLELKKLSVAGEIAELAKEISKKKKQKSTKDTEFTTKNTELDTLLKKIITKKRTELNQFNLQEFEDQTSTGGKDNRKTSSELSKLKLLLGEIRYLENEGDATLASSITEENTALTTIDNLWGQRIGNGFIAAWANLAWEKDKNETPTVEDKIKVIQAGQNPAQNQTLTYWYDSLLELEKIIKLEEWELAIKTKLKVAIATQSPTENNQEWRDTFKALETGLETAFTDTKITEWKKPKDGQTKFDNTASIKTLLEKVKGDEKFITFIKEKDTATDTLAKLIEQKDPSEVIKLITYYTEYDKLSEADKKTKKQKLVWTLEKKDSNGKYLDDTDLTETEITNTLYEIALGKKTLASQKKADEEQNQDDNHNKNEDEKNTSWWKFGEGNWRPFVTYGLISTLIMGGAGLALFWKQIKDWWKGPSDLDLETEGDSENSETEESDE